MHRLGLLLRPVSRIYQLGSKPCRTFSTTVPALKRLKGSNAGMAGFGEGFEELVETGTLSTSEKVDPKVEDSMLNVHQPPPAQQKKLKTLSPATNGFDAKSYFKSWSLTALEPILLENDLTLFSYLTQLIESPPSHEILGTVDHHQALDFQKRWIAYELDQENPNAHMPVLEFYLKHGVKFLPPKQGFDVNERMEKVDGQEAMKSLSEADISGSWVVNHSIFDELRSEKIEYPDLMMSDALLDPRDVLELPPSKGSPFHNRVVVRNHRSVFHDYAESNEDDLLEEDELAEDENMNQDETQMLPISSRYYKDLQQSILMRRGVVRQTGKGKIRRVAFMVLVGDGNGLVGYGEGKHSHGATALKAARLAAVRNMDYVERFEQRSIWTEMSTKLGSTHLILRPRPVGFGLRCNPHLHRILRAAGLKDVSAKVWGSRNKLNVMKAAFRLLHSGHAPTGMGDGLGGKGKKLAKGGGMKGKADLERARGRKLINLRK